jgi:uncharacterized protein YgiB involved in biofilm formation
MKRSVWGGDAREFVIVSVFRHDLTLAGTAMAAALLLSGCGGRDTDTAQAQAAAEQAAKRAETAAERAEAAAKSARAAAAPPMVEDEPQDPSTEENQDGAEPSEPGSVQPVSGN